MLPTDKVLPEQMTTNSTDANMRHQTLWVTCWVIVKKHKYIQVFEIVFRYG